MLFPARRSLNFLVFRSESGVGPWTFAAESIVLLAVACVISVTSRSILVMLDLIGSASAIAVDNVLPGIMFLCVTAGSRHVDESPSRMGLIAPTQAAEIECSSNDASHGQHLRSPRLGACWKRVIIACIVTIGALAGVASFVQSVRKAVA